MSYKIKRWDAISYNNLVKYAAIYIVPDLKLQTFAKLNNYVVPFTVTGTNSSYDNLVFFGHIDTSAYTPDCRPNFFNATKLWVVTLSGKDKNISTWNGYPPVEGLAMALGMKETPIKLKFSEPIKSFTPIKECFEPVKDNKGMCNSSLIMIILAIVIFVILIFLISYLIIKNKK